MYGRRAKSFVFRKYIPEVVIENDETPASPSKLKESDVTEKSDDEDEGQVEEEDKKDDSDNDDSKK